MLGNGWERNRLADGPFLVTVGQPSMNWAPAPLRRLALTLAAILAVLATGAVALWVSTPPAGDVQQRVRERTDRLGVVLLREDEVPPLLAAAVVATEDEKFYSHHGIDSIGLGRAALYDVTNLCWCEGGSTITEQLVKDVYLGGSTRGYNKVKELVLALKVERVITKGRIMADYLSEITTGYGRYGVSSAACAYFHAPLGRLTIGQYALLAGVTQAPSIYDPTVNPGAAAERRSHVLQTMLGHGLISAEQAAGAQAEPVVTPGSGC
jgi:membrane peptidoglycan carboxypeptidase